MTLFAMLNSLSGTATEIPDQTDCGQAVGETGVLLEAIGSGQRRIQRVVVAVVTRGEFATERQAIRQAVLHADAERGHRIPAAARRVADAAVVTVQQEARIGLVTQRAEAAHQIRTPTGAEFAEEPAAGHVELNALPLVTDTRRAVFEVGIVDAVLEIDCEIGIYPSADADAGEQRRIGRALAIGEIRTNARGKIPAAELLGVRYAYSAQSKGNQRKHRVTFHRNLLSAWFFSSGDRSTLAAR